MTRRRETDAGYILVAVLGVMLLLTAFLVAGSALIRSALHGAVVGDSALATQGLVQGGLELTAYQLFVRKVPAPQVDGRKIRFAGGTIQARIIDEAGKIDLNGADPKLLWAAFASVGLDAGSATALIARIVEVRGTTQSAAVATTAALAPVGGDIYAGHSPFATPGAPSVPGTAATTGPQRKRRGWQSVDQLRDPPSLSPAELRAVAPLLTVYNPDGKVDVLTASRAVMLAIPGLGTAAIDMIMARRINATKDTIVAMQPLFGEASVFIKTTPGPAYTVRIDAISGSGQRKALEAVIAASKSPNDPYLILDWRDGAS